MSLDIDALINAVDKNNNEVNGLIHSAKGVLVNKSGRTTLVGIANIAKTGNPLFDIFNSLLNINLVKNFNKFLD